MIVLERSVQYRGASWPSLSAVAREITGTRRSGPLFFGLKGRRDGRRRAPRAALRDLLSVTQQFNTTTSMGRLTLSMLFSFTQFEREVTGERIRDKIAASKRKGMWMGGFAPLGYEANGRTLAIHESEAETVRTVFRLYLEHSNVRRVKEEADRLGLVSKLRRCAGGKMRGGRPLSRGHIYEIGNPLYVGRIAHKGESFEGQHPPIIDQETWDAVHAKLTENRLERSSGTRASEPSSLRGKLFDEDGAPLTPSHAVKSGRRYRYYVSRDSSSGSDERIANERTKRWRLPAGRSSASSGTASRRCLWMARC